MLTVGSLHLPTTSHVCSGHIHHRSALWGVAGSSFGTMHHRWVVTDLYSSLLGPLVIIGPSSSSLVTWPVLVIIGRPIHRRHWVMVRAYSSSLECCQALHQVSLLLGCPTLHCWVLVPPCWHHLHGHGWGGLLVSYSMC